MCSAETDEKTENRRGAGRPKTRSDEETRRLIAQAASEEYLIHGYANTTIKAVVARAGISTKSLYRIVPDKAELFRLAMKTAIDERIKNISELPLHTTGNAVDGLQMLIYSYIRLLATKEAVLVNQLILAEQQDFPEVSQSFAEEGQRLLSLFDERVAQLCDLGVLACADPKSLADLVRKMIDGLRYRLILGQQKHLSEAELKAWAGICARLAVNGASGL